MLPLPELIALLDRVVVENVPLNGPPEEDRRTIIRLLRSSSL